MKRTRPYQAQKIGFLMGSGAPQPGMPSPFQSPQPFGGPPFLGGGSFPGGSPMMPPTGPPMSPFNPGAPGGGGLGGMLQGLLGGGGGPVNLPGLLANAQKVIGAINQAGEVFKNIGPMLQLLQGFNSSDLLADDDNSEIEQKKSQPKRKKRKKSRKRRKKRVRKKIKENNQ